MKSNTYKKMILIVDDIKINIDILRGILEDEYNIVEAENGMEALKIIHRNYKLLSAVILDLIMPEMDGFEVLSKIQENIVLSQIPIIVVTSDDSEETRVRALSLGANDFIIKPYNKEVIRHCLHNNIRLRETASIVNAIQKDKLTGIYSREAFFEKSEAMIKNHPEKYFLMECFDIDNFKLVNEQFGAAEGDRILKNIGTSLRKVTERIGGICCRISSDNFVVLYKNNSENVEAIKEAREKEFIPVDSRIKISFSIGIYVVSDLSLTASAMYDRAYIAKESVKGLYNTHIAYFNNSMLEELISEQQIISEMDMALANEQFEVWFQPQINHFTKSLIGAEALVRWKHPSKGLISPGIFIPIFEQNGFIYELDKFVWRSTCKHIRRWIDEGRNPMPVSVNISRLDLFRDDFVDCLNGYVSSYNIPVELLRLEITESAFSKSTKQIILVVKELKECGYIIEIDDFGSGYSSLNTLKEVPADVVKLDMHFFENGITSRRSESILESVVRMAKRIGMSVIAEGVENMDQANFLKAIDCNYVQGYLYAKPMPAKDYESFVKNIGKEDREAFTTVENDKRKAEKQNFVQKLNTDLLENLPCGAALYEYDGKNFVTLYINRKYINLLSTHLGEDSIIENVYINDREALLTEIKLAIEEKRNIEIDIRILYNKGEYIPFHITGKAIHKKDNKYLIYAIYTKVTEESMSYQAMLPIVLSTVMDTSSDISFVKNVNFRYVCCSKSFAELAGVEKVQDIVGKTDYDLIGREYADKYYSDDLQVKRTGKPILDYDEMLPMISKNKRYARSSKYPLLDSNGNVIGIYGITRDVSEYRSISERLTMLADNIPGGVASYMCKDGKLTLMLFNEGMYDFADCTREYYKEKTKVNPFFLVYREDIKIIEDTVKLLKDGKDRIESCVYRCYAKDGKYRWFSLKGFVMERTEEYFIVNIVQFDITRQKIDEENLKISNERFKIATELSEHVMARYDIKKDIFYHDTELLLKQGFEREIADAVDVFINSGIVDEDSAHEFADIYKQIRNGKKNATATVCLRVPSGEYRWFKADVNTLFDEHGIPTEAIFVFYDVTEQREKEAAYTKWKQSICEKNPEAYTLFQCNLNKDTTIDTREGSLIKIEFDPKEKSFNGRTREYASQYVFEEDREKYIEMLDMNAMFVGYYNGERHKTLEYRERLSDKTVKWVKLTVELVEYTDSSELKAYLLYEDIDEQKKAELMTQKRAENDALTNLFNRETFISKMEYAINNSDDEADHAFMMIDIDRFKQVNDVFGHIVGDNALIDVANTLKSIVGKDGIAGRLGGDEFVVFLDNISNDSIATEKAKKICELTQRSFSAEINISSSIGIAVCPRDGKKFTELYKKADDALYNIKGSGKNNYTFYREDMQNENLEPERTDKIVNTLNDVSTLKHHMLIIDDSNFDYEIVANIFKDKFIVDRAKDGESALTRLRHYGTAISVVLLDWVMPGMGGEKVLEKMRENIKTRDIPVIVVSGADYKSTSLCAIKNGAYDFVTKPIDADLLRTRVNSAITKAENNRLRVQNDYLQIQNNEVTRYRTVLKHMDITVIEHDWVKGDFIYDTTVSAHIAGIYDNRKLWRILLSDMVTDTATVRKMQELIHDMANDRSCSEQAMMVQLKTPTRKKHWFKMSVYKIKNEFNLADKFVLTFWDKGEEFPDEYEFLAR